jgi:hypothetical protein
LWSDNFSWFSKKGKSTTTYHLKHHLLALHPSLAPSNIWFSRFTWSCS